MHQDRESRRPMAGIDRCLSSQSFVAELHAQGYAREAAEEIVSQVYGVTPGAARLYVRSHPCWDAEGETRGLGGRAHPPSEGR